MTAPNEVVAALVDALNSTAGASPALSVLSRPKYPMRELCPRVAPDGSLVLTLSKWGYEYKHRGTRPKAPPSADTEAIRDVLTLSLRPYGLLVKAVRSHDTYVNIFISEFENGVTEK